MASWRSERITRSARAARERERRARESGPHSKDRLDDEAVVLLERLLVSLSEADG